MSGLRGQENADSTQYLLSEGVVLSGFGGPFAELSSIHDQAGVCLGAGGALVVNQTVFLGAYFEGLVTNHYMEELQSYVNIERPKVSFEHGGLWFGYVYKPKKPVHGGISMKLGWGEISLEGDEFDDDVDVPFDFDDRIFSVIPQLELELNMTRWFRINAGVGYRFVTGIDADYIDDAGNEAYFYDQGDFNSITGTITLIFGGHGKKD
jgi:hypothetical protein